MGSLSGILQRRVRALNPDTYSAVILAGGRSSRLGGVPKALLEYDGATLLARTLASVRTATRVAVVGPEELSATITGYLESLESAEADQLVVLTREDPPFSGPAAGIVAGVRALRELDSLAQAGTGSEYTLLLACDMPLLGALPETLLRVAREHPEADVCQPLDASGRAQPLASCVATEALQAAVAELGDTSAGMSVSGLLASLQVYRFQPDAVAGSDAATSDVDTWESARAFGIEHPSTSGGNVAEQPEILQDWVAELLTALELDGTPIDIPAVLALAGEAAHQVVRPAAPLTTFVVGYAAGLAVASGQASEAEAMKAAGVVAEKLCRGRSQ